MAKRRVQGTKMSYVVDESGNVLGTLKAVSSGLGIELRPRRSENYARYPSQNSTEGTSPQTPAVPAAKTPSSETGSKLVPTYYFRQEKFDRLVCCPHCSGYVRLSILSDHIAQAHPMERDDTPDSEHVHPRADSAPKSVSVVPKPAPQQSAPPSLSLVKCSICGVEVRSDRLKKHELKVHQQPVQAQPKPILPSESQSTPAAPSQSANLVQCPTCGVKIKPTRLSNHLAKVHRQRLSTNTTRQRNVTLPGRTSKPDDDAFHQDSIELRDGGKYLGYMQRENGRFGSLPLYDDYGDEASAE